MTVRIKLVILGNLKRAIDFKYIENWKTSLFLIVPRDIRCALPDMQVPSSGYTDHELAGLIVADPNVDLTIGLINAPIENNFYERPIAQNMAVISLYEMDEIVESAQHRIEHFILRCLYVILVAYIESNRSLSMGSVFELGHDEVRNCLYDMNINKADVIYSLDPPRLCETCMTRLSERQLDVQFMPALKSELSKIRKGFYYRATGWAKKHPAWALIVTSVFGIFLNLIGNTIYDYSKGFVASREHPVQVIHRPDSGSKQNALAAKKQR